MHHDDREGIRQLNAVVAVGNAVQTVCHRCIKAQQLRRFFPIDVVCGASQCTAAQRAFVHTLCCVVQSAQITEQHLYICQQVVCKSHRLGTLQMGIAGEHGFGVLFCQLHQHGTQLFHQSADLLDLVPQIQPQIQCHLIVSGTGGVQPLAHIAVTLGQLCLHEHVNVLRIGIKFQLAAVQICQNGSQPLNNGLAVLLGDDAAVPQHGGMGDTALNVMPVHTGIKCDRGVKRIYACVNFFGKSSCPKCHI